MARLFYLKNTDNATSDHTIASHALLYDAATRIDEAGRIGGSGRPAASVVAFATTPTRFALVSHTSARVQLGAQLVPSVAALEDRDRIFVAGREMLLALDALPIEVAAAPDEICRVCNRKALEFGGLERACPRCGARACERCWSGFRNGVCLTPHCHQPAELERPLWSPALTDFLDFSGDTLAGPET